MVLYLLLCVISVFAGCGILGLIGVDVDRCHTLFLSPVITLCFLAILMGGLVAGGFAVGEITPITYTLCFAAALVGAIRYGKLILQSWRALLVLAALAMLILLPSVVQGVENYSGGLCMDGWSYVTVGQSLQHYPLGSDGWFPLETQYAAQWGKAIRFISPAFLALLAPLSGEHNDTQEVLGHYLGWLFFVYASACLFFAKAARLNRYLTWTFVFLATLSGWTLRIINTNNVDNVLALCFLPAVLGILILIPGPSIRYGIVLGAILAAGLYAYPESAPFTGAAILAMGTQRILAAKNQLRQFMRMGAALLVSMALCILPFASQSVSFFLNEVRATQAVGSRPGEPYYHSLSTPGFILGGYWGLTPDFDGRPYVAEMYLRHYDLYATTVSVILTLAALLGIFLLLWRRNWTLPAFALSMTAAYTILLVHFRYPYAAYKFLVLTWFAMAYLVIIAGERVWQAFVQQPAKWMTRSVVAVGLALIILIGASFFLQEKIFYDLLPFKSVREFKKVSVVENLVHGGPLAMIVYEDYANIWATHFLRHTKLYLADEYRGYMEGLKPLLERSEPVNPSDIRFVVTDQEQSFDKERLIGKAGPYYIWDCRRGPWVLLTRISRLEAGGTPEPFFWMGKTYSELRILSSAATSAIVSADFSFASNPAQNVQQRVRIRAAGFDEERLIGCGEQSFRVPLQPGLNRVLLRSVEEHPLLIRVAHLSVSTPSKPEIGQIHDSKEPKASYHSDRISPDPAFQEGRN